MESNILDIECKGIENGGKFPLEYTGRGQDSSPLFRLKNLSPEAKTLAVTLEDISHPIKNFTHWVIWNIPAGDMIPEGINKGKQPENMNGARQGIAYGFHRYAGPKPPMGSTHSYRFTVYALDCEIDLTANSTKSAFLKKADGHIIQKGSITADFG